jgi:membrane fusion protein
MKPDAFPTEPLPLFRAAAVAAARPQLAGEIVLNTGLSSRWGVTVAWVVVLSLSLLLAFGQYTRRTTVQGQLFPSEGLIRVTAAQPGVVVESHVKDGQLVTRGNVLFVLSGDRLGQGAQGYQLGMAQQVQARQRSLQDDLLRLQASQAQEQAQLQRRTVSLRQELEQIARQADPLSQRLAGAEDAQRRYSNLFRQGYVARDELLAKEAEVSELRGRLQGNRRDALVLERELAAAQREMEQSASRTAGQRAEVERAILLTGQEFTEIESRRRVVITAPADGKVTLLQAEVGQSVDMGRPLAQLLPASARLVARLYVPSRSAGFVRPGAAVLLRFDAFAHQQYGQVRGEVLSVSQAGVMSQEIQGYSPGPALAGQTLFEVVVAMPETVVSTNGRTLAVQAGMRVEADLMHETRRLYEWVIEPLLTAQSRIAPR